MTLISIAGAVKALAGAKKISLARAKIEVIEACAAGLIEARWCGEIRGSSPLIERQKWIGADIDLSSGVVILANDKRMAQVKANAIAVDGWVNERAVVPFSAPESAPQTRTQPKQDRAREAIKALWPNRPTGPNRFVQRSVMPAGERVAEDGLREARNYIQGSS